MLTIDTIKTQEDYDNYLKQHITEYCVSTRTPNVRRGIYQKEFFKNFEDAQNYYKQLQTSNPNTRSLIYGISKPPHTVLDVNVVMEVA